MAQIILRQASVIPSTGGTVKGSPLTNAEVDNNFANLNVATNTLDTGIGTLSSLTTIVKTSVVGAINELRGNLSSSAQLATLISDETGTGLIVANVSPVISSPTFANSAISVTAANLTSNTMVATTEFVNNQIGLGRNSPSLTGTPQAVTAANATSNSMIATTQFVLNQISGTVTTISPSFTGTPQSITASVGTSNAMIATTAFVSAAVAAGGGGVTTGKSIAMAIIFGF